MMQARLQQIDPRSLRLILALLWLVLVAGLLLYGLRPKYLSYRQGAESLYVLNNEVNDEAQLRSEIAKVRTDVEALRQTLQGDAENLPLNQMESYLISRLQGVSWSTGTELIGVRPGHATPVLGFDEVAFEVEVRGDYHALYAWLRELVKNLGFILVKRYEITHAGNTERAGLLHMRLTTMFYRMKQE